MVRSWDARVRGATEKVAPQTDESITQDSSSDAVEAPAQEPSPQSAPTRPETAPQATAPATASSEQTAPTETAPTESSESSESSESAESEADESGTSDSSAQQPVSLYEGLGQGNGVLQSWDHTAEIVIEGLSTAVAAIGLCVAVVDRSSGQILWSSEAWTSRFGVEALLSRHWPTSTDLGESPLPSSEESWQRKRTMLLADGSEDLVDLLLIGAATPQGQNFVTVVAKEGSPKASTITDRAEVIGIIEGSMQVALAAVGKEASPTEALPTSGPGADLNRLIGVLYVDLDRFKVVHDLVGNLEALRLLELVSRRIRTTMRSTDLFFRLPSDEFVVVVTQLDHPNSAEEVAERVRSAVATMSDLGNDMAITASVGVALADHDQTGDELLSAAETAVYLAKGRGRNRVAVHDEELRARSKRLLVVERQLRRAIDRRDVRFAYQPVVHMRTGAVVGAEALLRLGGDIGLSAMEVIQAAEHSGLMGALGSLVIEGVDEQLSAMLRDPGNDFEIMVNLSGTQLEDDVLLGTLARFANDPKILPGRLSVEVPEAVVEQNRRAFLALAELVRPRFRIGIDGFGTTMASAEMLEALPIDYIKLHRTVTSAAGLDGAGQDHVALLAALAQERGIATIALGVESVAQVEVLSALGCELAQGFLYAGAVAAEDLTDLIQVGFDGATSVAV